MTVRIVAATDAKIARGEDVALPAAVWAAIESGEHPIRAIRKYRGLTQIDVAEIPPTQRSRPGGPWLSKCNSGIARSSRSSASWPFRTWRRSRCR